MDPFRLALAQEVAEQIGAVVLPEPCPACRHPLVMKSTQAIPFCWFCTTDRIAAQRGKTALTRAKLADKGIILGEDMYACPALADSKDAGPSSSWPEGWTL